MDRRVALGLAIALTLAGCQKSQDEAAPAPAASLSPLASATPVAAPPAACEPAPALVPAPDFADPRGQFAKGGKAYAQLAANFAAAYGKACGSGLLKAPLVSSEVAHPGNLFLHNAPEANEAAIYDTTDDGGPGDMTLEYYFITADGQAHVPSEADLSEAIYCAAHGATEQEEAATGRCLVD